MFQQLLLILVAAGAAFYLARMVYRSFQAKNSCASGCGKCAEATQIKKA
jgi:hypothetical protein